MSKLTIRTRQKADYPGLVQVLMRCHQVDKYPVMIEHASESFLEDPKLLQSWVAVVDGQVIGNISTTKSPSDPAISLYRSLHGPEDLVAINRLFIDPAKRGNGAARQLLETALVWGEENGSKVVLNTEVTAVASRRFYSKCGWEEFGETCQHLTFDSKVKSLDVVCFKAPERKSSQPVSNNV